MSMASTFYFDRTFDCDAAKILPGEYYCSEKDMVLVTVLGSCVAACIRDKVSGVGGMNHFMLPEAGAAVSTISMRYGNHAMDILISELLKAGAQQANLEAKVFGGGNVLPGMATMSVGERNAEFVRHYLKVKNINIVAEDLIDIYPRKVYFFPRTGKVLVKKLKVLQNDTLAQREIDYAKRLRCDLLNDR